MNQIAMQHNYLVNMPPRQPTIATTTTTTTIAKENINNSNTKQFNAIHTNTQSVIKMWQMQYEKK